MTDKTIKPPKTYWEWVELLTWLQEYRNDPEVLTALKNGSIEWQVGVKERFVKKLIECINYRLKNAIQKLNQNLVHAMGKESRIVQVLISIRSELVFLSQVVNLKAIPDNERILYNQLLKQQADKIQNSLDDFAKVDRTGKMSSIVNNNRVNKLDGYYSVEIVKTLYIPTS
jgi:hypothetical protein